MLRMFRGITMTFLIAALALLCSVGPAHATTVYSQAITSSTYYVTIDHATHGFANHKIAVLVYDGDGLPLSRTAYSWSWNLYNDITISINDGLSSGNIKLIGLFESDTSASTDFQVTAGTDGSSNPRLAMCSACALN